MNINFEGQFKYSFFSISLFQCSFTDISAKIDMNRLYIGSILIGVFLKSSDMEWFDVTISTL